MRVDVSPVAAGERAIVENLWELYLYDFSLVEGGPIGADGRFSTPGMLDPYWDDPQRRVFLIRADEQLAGFAMTKRGSALAGDLEALDLAEFFVLGGYRRSGVGRAAAMIVWDLMPDRWLVRVLAANRPALAFWERVVAGYTGGQFSREVLRQDGHEPPRDWVIFRFRSRAGR